MSDLSINASNLLSSLSSLSSTQSSSQADGGSASTNALPPASGGGKHGAHVGISNRGKLQQELQQLQQKNPAQYKQTVTQIANQLNQAASQSSGNAQKFLSALATAFQNAENGSNVTLPQPSGSGNGSSSSAVQAAYSAAQQTSPDQQALSALAQSGNSTNPIQSSTVQTALDSIFQIVNSAVSGLSA